MGAAEWRRSTSTALGATHFVAERGDAGLAAVRALTEGIGAGAVLECVGTAEARPQAVAAYLPHLLDLGWTRRIRPGKVFVLTLPLSEGAEAYRAMDERRAIKVLPSPELPRRSRRIRSSRGTARRGTPSRCCGRPRPLRGRA